MDTYEKARQLVQILLKGESETTPATIRDAIQRVLPALGEEGRSIDTERLAKDLETRFNVWVGQESVLQDVRGHEPWLPDRRSLIAWRFWKRYERYLEEDEGWAPQAVIRVGQLTDSILEKLEAPDRPGAWDRRGVVVGHVQSGKTSNYIALVCKAVDAGYKLIIVLAGLHKNLRSQTQLRIDQGFLGFDTQRNRAFDQNNLRIGAGALPGAEFLLAHSLTSSADGGDFNSTVANNMNVVPGGEPIVLVVKKNKSVLQNLLNWAIGVRGEIDPRTNRRVVRDVPLLVIDDEADNASINTNPPLRDADGNILADQDVTAINGLIRRLLNSFEKSAYVGYTATPFANIFIYPDGEHDEFGEDLFPRSFIINLPAPSNYLGPSRVFGITPNGSGSSPEQRELPVIRVLDDYGDAIPNNHKKTDLVMQLPDSLRQAIKAFVLVCAARACRGQSRDHNSMLIHVTRFTAVQASVLNLVQEELRYIQQRLEYLDSKKSSDLLRELEMLWEKDFIPTTAEVARELQDESLKEVPWAKVREQLFASATKIQLKTINGSAKDVLDYYDHKNGLSVIAIGGDKLSRGLTLEGLSVSYFLRASRMYDTLMQMGRWFGYRPGYADLSRLYTSNELVDWYRHISAASEELREEFDHMAAVGGTPEDYGLRVRRHPNGLLITAVNKMPTGTRMQVSYAGSITETVVFDSDPRIIDQNFRVFDAFFERLGTPEANDHNYLWREVSGGEVVQLMSTVRTHPNSFKAQSNLIMKYIQAQLAKGELARWTVALLSRGDASGSVTIAHREIGLIERKLVENSNGKCSIQRLVSPRDETLDLDKAEKEAALLRTQEHWTQNRGKYRRQEPPDLPSGAWIRKIRPPQRGLLLVYPLETLGKDPAPLIGFAVSFPSSETAVAVEYMVNNVYWEQEFGAQ